MTNKKIKEYGVRLVEVNKVENFSERKRQLKELAREVGAGQAKYFVRGDEDTLSELTDNIHNALQTATQINNVTMKYKIALTIAGLIIAFLSMLAAWIAVLHK